jgi:hypothetical protein
MSRLKSYGKTQHLNGDVYMCNLRCEHVLIPIGEDLTIKKYIYKYDIMWYSDVIGFTVKIGEIEEQGDYRGIREKYRAKPVSLPSLATFIVFGSSAKAVLPKFLEQLSIQCGFNMNIVNTELLESLGDINI